MLHDYKDIRDRIDEEPKWFDTHGVPRYCEMNPSECPNIYADLVMFVNIACQSCGERFNVEMHSSSMDRAMAIHRGHLGEESFKVENVSIDPIRHYGDPPRHNGCAGETMNCDDPYLLEVHRKIKSEWVKDSQESIDEINKKSREEYINSRKNGEEWW
jgi:hypothetical protein